MGRDRGSFARYPISLDLSGRLVVVVGGGRVAERKVEGLLAAGAAVTVIAPELTDGLQQLAAACRLTLRQRAFDDGDLESCALVFAATGSDEVNAAVRRAARFARIPVNDAADGDEGDFSVPAVHRAGTVSVAVDTAGGSPSFARRVRDDVARLVDGRYARAAASLARMRAYALNVLPPAERAQVLARLAAADLDELATMSPAAAEDAVDRAAFDLRASNVAYSAAHPLVCATRGSALAVWQARHVMTLLAERGTASTILTVSTVADRITDRPLNALGTDNVFIRELETALRQRRADFAVHSCKDLPSRLADDMRLAAVSAREDPRDAFCSERFKAFSELPAGAVVGTSSPRRLAQLRSLRADLRYEPIRGNVDTRLRKLREDRYDAIVLAMAGMARLGLRATHTVPLDPSEIVPAAGQGALAVECRRGDEAVAELVHLAVADRQTELCVGAERAFLRALRAGCQAPVGAYATIDGAGALTLTGMVAALDGSQALRGRRTLAVATVAEAERVGEALAAELLAQGAAQLLSQPDARALEGKLFLLPRTQGRESRIAPALRSAGGEVIEARDSADATTALEGRVPDVLLFPSSGAVAAVAEYLAGLRTRGGHPMVAAMGPSSSDAAASAGFPPDVIAAEPAVGSFVHCITQYVLERATSAP